MTRESSRAASLLRGLTAQTTIAICGLVVGVVLLALSAWPHVADVLKIAGTALVAAFLSMLLAIVSSREAVRRQNARDAHLRARGESYSPLNAELKALRRRLEQARDGQAGYPSAIGVRDIEPTVRRGAYLPITPDVNFMCWEDYKTDARELDFTPQAGLLLDGVVKRIREYNAAVKHAREASIPILAAHIRSARQVLQRATIADGVRLWLTFELNYRDRQRRPDTGSEAPLENAWYATLLDERAPDTMAASWITGMVYGPGGPPKTLGWLLATRTDRAAEAALALYPSDAPFSTAPVDWVQGILDGALPDLVQAAGYEEVSAAFKVLLKDVQAADSLVLTALRSIREQYEGGPPLI